MRIGVCATPQGTATNPAAMRAAALAAEQVGYASIWVGDEPAGLDPVAVLGGAAALTTRVGIGVSRLAVTRYAPAPLARALRTLTLMSGGRFTAALDLGAGMPEAAATLGGFVEHLDQLAGDNARARPEILIATGPAPTPDCLELVGRSGAGWHPRGIPVDELAAHFATVRAHARAAGHDPDAVRLVVRADVQLSDHPAGTERSPYCGDLDQITADLDATRRAGADEVVLALRREVGFDAALDTFARLAEAVEASERTAQSLML